MSYDERIAQERTKILLGGEGLALLASKHVLIVGLGGVGGAVAEAIARSGIGRITLLDHDTVGLSNMNRQLVCTTETLGKPKAQAMGERVLSINPHIGLETRQLFLNPDNIRTLLKEGNSLGTFDYVLDCIDSVSCKADLVASCQQLGIPVASSMGAGGRLDVTQARIVQLKDTYNCGLAANLRRRLRRKSASLKYPVVFSSEVPIKPLPQEAIPGQPDAMPRAVNGTISYMPNLFGFMLAGYVVKDLLGDTHQ